MDGTRTRIRTRRCTTAMEGPRTIRPRTAPHHRHRRRWARCIRSIRIRTTTILMHTRIRTGTRTITSRQDPIPARRPQLAMHTTTGAIPSIMRDTLHRWDNMAAVRHSSIPVTDSWRERPIS